MQPVYLCTWWQWALKCALERKSYIIVLLTCSRPMYFINHLRIINRLMFIKYILTEKLICNDVATNMMQIATMFIQNDFLGNYAYWSAQSVCAADLPHGFLLMVCRWSPDIDWMKVSCWHWLHVSWRNCSLSSTIISYTAQNEQY